MKITKYIAGLAAAAGMLLGCQRLEMVQVCDPSEVVPPVLNAVEDLVITADNMMQTATFTWDAADFGAKVAVEYALEASYEGGDIHEIVVGLSGTSARLSYEVLNLNLYNNVKLPADTPVVADFYISARVGSGQKFYSEPVKVNVQVTAAEKKYPILYIVGSYNGWSHDRNQYIFDFDGNDDVYQGMIDFGKDHASNEFKITGGAWGKDEHSMNGPHDPESKTINLVAGGGDNINVYQAKRFYHLTFSRSALTLTADFAVNSLGISGDFNGWGWTELAFDEASQKFYADVEIPAEGGLKFRESSENWDQNWGTAAKYDDAAASKEGVLDGGENVKVPAGNYRVYVNMNNAGSLVYQLNADDYGKQQEIVIPDKPVMTGWGVVGSITNWGNLTEENTYITDIPLLSDGTWYVASNVEVPAEGAELKFRLDGAWDSQWGAGEGFVFAADTELALGSDNPGNIVVPAGTYNVYLNPETGLAWFVTDGSYPGGGAAPEPTGWGIVGDVNGWGFPDVNLYAADRENLFVAKAVPMPAGGFKIRKSEAGEWNDEYNYGLETSGNVEVDHAYDVITSGGSGNLMLEEPGTFDIWFDLDNAKVYIMTPGKPISEAEGGVVDTPDPSTQPWYLVGNFNGWSVGDANYQLTKEGSWYVFKNFVADGQGVKFNAGSWSVNRGGNFVAANEAIELTQDGPDMTVAAGTYDVYMNETLDKAWFMTPGTVPSI